MAEEHLDPLLPFAALVDQRGGNRTVRADRACLGRDPTPAAGRPSTARADAWRRHGRSWGASFIPAERRSPPARRDARGRRPLAAPGPRTASPSSPPTPPRAAAAEPAQEPPHTRAVRGPHPRPADLARLGVDPLGRDLRPMFIKSHHDRHRARLPSQVNPASSSTRALTRTASSPTHRIPWVTVGTSSSNGRPRGRQSARASPTPFDAEGRPPLNGRAAPACSCHRCGTAS